MWGYNLTSLFSSDSLELQGKLLLHRHSQFATCGTLFVLANTLDSAGLQVQGLSLGLENLAVSTCRRAPWFPVGTQALLRRQGRNWGFERPHSNTLPQGNSFHQDTLSNYEPYYVHRRGNQILRVVQISTSGSTCHSPHSTQDRQMLPLLPKVILFPQNS